MQDNDANKANGYNRNLYRDPDKAKLAGICAGLARAFNIPVWVARLIAISLFIFATQLFLIAYIAGIFLLAKQPERLQQKSPQGQSNKLFDYQKPAGQRLRDIQERLRTLDAKLRNIEGYITSKRFQVRREINDL